VKNYYKYLIIGLTLFIGLAFLPVVVDSFADRFRWEIFATAYQHFSIHLPIILR
jgi:hypothetical protein